MGYNFFNIVEVPKAFNQKLNDFRKSLGEAICKGKDITFADNDITYALKLQHDRITEKGLELDYDIYSRGENQDRFTSGSQWRDAHYESRVCHSPFGIKRRVKQNGKIRYSDNRKSVLYEPMNCWKIVKLKYLYGVQITSM